jgi:protein-S-isoprenylcysteine O-methyltransferase Ste14
MPSNGAVEHPTECDTIDRAGLDAEANDAARVLIHDHQDPVGPQRGRVAPEQIHAPQAGFPVAQESQPGGTIGVLPRPVVMSENPSNHVFVDLDVERQGDLLSNSRTAPAGITLLHFDDGMNEFYAGVFFERTPEKDYVVIELKVLTAIGVAISIWARLSLGSNWSGMVTLKNNHELIRTGLYRWIRHPIYSGILLGMIGTAMIRGQLRGVIGIAVVLAAFYFKARREERFLREEFGAQFDEHEKVTGMFLPRLT